MMEETLRLVFDEVLNLSISGSWVIAFVLTARLLLRKAPARFRYLLWGLVLLRLLCPLPFESPVSMMPEREPLSVNAWTPAETEPFPQTEPVFPEDPAEAVPYLTAPAEPSAAPPNLRRAVLRTLRAAWIPGMVLLLAGSFLSLRKLRRRLIGAVPLRGNIWIADHIETAFAAGIFRPRIYLPSSLSEEEQNYILLHERTHLRRHDPLWKSLGFLALCVHWFNPLVWVAMHFAERDLELSCDEAVLRQLGPEIRQAYASSLLRLASGRTAGVAFGKGSTKARILNILHYRRPKLFISLAAATSVILLSCGLLTNPVKATQTASIADQSLCGIYDVQEIVGQWRLSSVYNPDPETIGSFSLVGDSLYHTLDKTTSYCGELQETTLEAEDFDHIFDVITLSEADQRTMKAENAHVWRSENGSAFHLVLAQEDGSVYLLTGRLRTKVGPYEYAPRIQYAYLLERRPPIETPLPGTYFVSQILYDSPSYSFTYTTDTAPVYTIDPSGMMTAENAIRLPVLGEMRKTILTPQNFDALFTAPSWAEQETIAQIREQAANVWILENEQEFHYLILLEDEAALLLASGYRENGTPSSIRWLFQLSQEPAAPDGPALTYDAGTDLEGAYPVSEIIYQGLHFSTLQTLPETPVFWLSETFSFSEQLPGEDRPIPIGTLNAETLDEERFRSLFPLDDLGQGLTTDSLLADNLTAWQLLHDGRFELLLLQENGSLFLVRGITRNGEPLLTNYIYLLEPRKGTAGLQYLDAYRILLACRTDGFESQTVNEFKNTFARNARSAETRLRQYEIVGRQIHTTDRNADYFNTTVKAACGELYADAFQKAYTYSFALLEQRHPIEAPSMEEVELLSTRLPLYEFLFSADVCVTYTINDSVTVGTRDNILRSLRNGLGEALSNLRDDELDSYQIQNALSLAAEDLLRRIPHDGMEVSVSFENVQISNNRTGASLPDFAESFGEP